MTKKEREGQKKEKRVRERGERGKLERERENERERVGNRNALSLRANDPADVSSVFSFHTLQHNTCEESEREGGEKSE